MAAAESIGVEATRHELWQLLAEFDSEAQQLQALEPARLLPTAEQVLAATGTSVSAAMPYEVLRRHVCQERAPSRTQPASLDSSAFVHFGVEVRHLPLIRCLPGAPKYISTRNWALARDELKFSRMFDRVAELRQANEWAPTHLLNGQPFPTPPTHWNRLLEEAWFMARDFAQEQVWKRSMARTLAHEARELRRVRFAGKDTACHYVPSRHLLTKAVREIYWTGSGLVVDYEAGPQNSALSRSAPIEGAVPKASTFNFTAPSGHSSSSHVEWSAVEESLLARLLRTMPGSCAFETVAQIVNMTCHSGRRVRSTSDIYRRIPHLAAAQDASVVRHNVKRHLDRMALMNAASTKLIAPKQMPMAKKLSMAAHPSHEATARKANQNISKLLTPQELAMRRIQRTRIMTDPSGAIMSVAPPNPAGIAMQRAPMPPGSPGQRPVNAAAYQAAVAAASAAARAGVSLQGSPAISAPPTPMRPAVPSAPRPGMVLPNAAIAQQQRQALLNRSHQMTSYIATMQARPAASPLLRPPAEAPPQTEPSPQAPPGPASPAKTPPKTRSSRKQ